ncbi:hypothetical protein [Parabacteroides sp.]
MIESDRVVVGVYCNKTATGTVPMGEHKLDQTDNILPILWPAYSSDMASLPILTAG